MKLTENRIDMHGRAPREVMEAMYTIGHWLANNAPDMDANFNVTEGDEVVTYQMQVQEVGRNKWLIEGEVIPHE